VPQRRFGVRQLMIDGVVYLAKSGCDYSLGLNKQESVMGLDTRHGVKITRMPAYLEVSVTDTGTDFDLKKLTSMTDVEVTVDLESGKTVKFGHANYCGEGKVSAAEGEVEAKFECDESNAEEI